MGNIKDNADFSYKFNGKWFYEYNVDRGLGIAHQHDGFLYVIVVDSVTHATTGPEDIPESAELSVFRVDVSET